MTYENPTSQAERRATLENDRAVREQGSTFKTFADAFSNEGKESGRFSKLDASATTKRLPEGSPWSGVQPGPGKEKPLGFSIDEMQPTGEVFEVRQSLESGAPVSPSVDATDRGGAVQPHCSAPTSSEEK
jgi:hypothetical protein